MELEQLFEATVVPKEGDANIEQISEERVKQIETLGDPLEVD